MLTCSYYNDFCDYNKCRLNFHCRLNYNEPSFIVIYRIWLIFNIFPHEWFLLKEELAIPIDINRFIIILFLNERYSEVNENIFFEYIGHCFSKDCHDLSYYYKQNGQHNRIHMIYVYEDYGSRCEQCYKCVCETCCQDGSLWKEDTVNGTGLYCITCWENDPYFRSFENVDEI